MSTRFHSVSSAALLAISLASVGCLAPRPEPVVPVEASAPATAPREPDPEEIAVRVIDALGGAEAWAETRHVAWTFFGVRRHLWDRHAGLARVESGDLVVLIDLATREGSVWEAGEPVVDLDRRRELFDQAYAWWVNDSYWMFMPFKLRDPGARLAYGGVRELEDGREAHVLELSFDSEVGLTPQNRYEIFVDAETDLVAGWIYRATPDAEPRDLGPWRGWQRFGQVLLATDHGRDFDWQVAEYDELAPEVYEDPRPRGI
jgi:hypothetical protein